MIGVGFSKPIGRSVRGMTEGAVSDPGDAAGRNLTPREREVLQHAALGLSNRQIGEALTIAEQTVKNHLGSAMRKLSLHDRTHAVVFAIGSGLISLPLPSPDLRAGEGMANSMGLARSDAID